MRILGLSIMLAALLAMGYAVANVEDPAVPLLGLLLVMWFGVKLIDFAEERGGERIWIEPSPAPGFNAWYERRTFLDWERIESLSGWGATEEKAEADCRDKVEEWKANNQRIERTPPKVIDL